MHRLQVGSMDQDSVSLWTPANGVEQKRQKQPRQKELSSSGRSKTGEAAARSEAYSASISG